MATDPRVHLAALLEATPEGQAVVVPRAWLASLLEASTPSADATVAEVAQRYRRGPSTIRGWAEQGRFPGAYKLGQREWRFPLASLAAFEATDRTVRSRSAEGPTLGDWRNVKAS